MHRFKNTLQKHLEYPTLFQCLSSQFKNFVKWALLISFLGLLLGCRAQPTKSVVRHLAGVITGSETNAALWVPATRANLNLVFGTSDADYLSARHPLTQRLQFWLSALDGAARSRYPAALKGVPLPEVQILREEMPGAFQRPTPLCVSSKLSLASGSGDSHQFLLLGLDPEAGFRPVVFADKKICQKTISAGDFAKLLPWYNGQFDGATGCRLDAVAGGGFAMAPGCHSPVAEEELAEDQKDLLKKRFAGFAVFATSNQIVVHTGLLRYLTEEETIATLAHELGHYYKQTVARPQDIYHYFYRIGERNENGKPPPGDAALQALGAELQNAALLYAEPPPPLPQQELLDEAFEAVYKTAAIMKVGGSGAAFCEATDASCASSCNLFFAASRDFDWTAVSPFPWQLKDPQVAQVFLQLQNAFKACAQRLIADHGKWSSALLDDAESSPLPLRWSASELPPRATTSLWDLLMAGQKKFPSEIRSQSIKEEKKKFEEATAKRLGWYTPEQEADELGLELMHLLNLRTEAALDLHLRLINVLGTYLPLQFTELTTSACIHLAKNNWLDADGKPVFVPVGNFTDNHHSSCFRAFNVSREIAAHSFGTPGTTPPPPLLSLPEWNKLREEISLLPANITAQKSPTSKRALTGIGGVGAVGCRLAARPVSHQKTQGHTPPQKKLEGELKRP